MSNWTQNLTYNYDYIFSKRGKYNQSLQALLQKICTKHIQSLESLIRGIQANINQSEANNNNEYILNIPVCDIYFLYKWHIQMKVKIFYASWIAFCQDFDKEY